MTEDFRPSGRTAMSADAATKETNRISFADVFADSSLINKKITVCGWVRTRRDSKAGFSFIALSDGSVFKTLQIVVPSTLSNYQEEILHVTTGCSLEVEGIVVPSPAAGQPIEVHAEKIKVVGWVEDPDTYPIAPKHHTFEYLREVAHLRARTNVIGASTRIQHHLGQAIHRFFAERGFFWIRTPIITSNDCEGAGQLFRVTTLNINEPPRSALDGKVDFEQDFFGREAYLTVSGQLNVEAYCLALSKVYTFGPTFRAENSNTTRHLAEFWQIEPEIAFANLKDVAFLAEDMLRYLAKVILEECKEDMAFFAERIDKQCIQRLEDLVAKEFVHMEYSDAIEALSKAKKEFVFPVHWGMDLQSEHERYLTEELVNGPVVVMNYPREIKSFYMRLNDDGKTVAAMDVLAPGIGEIIGGSQREERLDLLEGRIKELKMNRELYQWYLDLRRYGSVPHGGFGMGFERLVGYFTGLGNIRDTIPFPRTPKHAEY